MAQKKIILLGAIITLLSPLAFAASMTMILGPISVTLPTGWTCQTQELNYICLDKSPTSKRNSAFVVTFKRRTAEDTNVIYRDQLARPRNLYKGEVATPSEPRGVTERKINGFTWIEGIHFGSEVPNYYTHYYAASADPWAILVSFSIEKSAYTETLPMFQPVIASMRIVDLKPGNGESNSTMPVAMGSQEAPHNTKIGRVEILGYSLPRMYLAMALGVLVVLGLLGYALFAD